MIVDDYIVHRVLPGHSPVQLLSGRLVDAETVGLAWRLEARGCYVGLNPAGELVVAPQDRVTRGERLALARHHGELVSLVKGCEVVA